MPDQIKQGGGLDLAHRPSAFFTALEETDCETIIRGKKMARVICGKDHEKGWQDVLEEKVSSEERHSFVCSGKVFCCQS